MISRRHFLAGTGATVLAAPALASNSILISQTEFPRLRRRLRPQTVTVSDEFNVGDIYVYNADFFLYHIIAPNEAMRYGIALGAEGREFLGHATIDRKAEWPRWTPTRNMIEMEPDVYGPYRAGLPGGHEMNPMGAAALYLSVDGRPTTYRIHGTNLPTTIGTQFSSGCIRLRNDHMTQLYNQVPVGTNVWVV